MRHRHCLAALVSLLIVVTLAGCGSSSGSGASPLATELSYFPAGAPFVLTVQTDPNSTAIKQAHQLEAKFPLAALGQAAITSRLQQLGLNYDTDIRPLFGHPVAVGAAGATLSGARQSFLIVWQTADAGKLNAVLKKLGAANSVGTRDGAKLYGSGSSSIAVDGSTLVFGPSATIVTGALDRHAHGGGITTAQYTRETAGLDTSSLGLVFGDLSGLLSRPSAASTRQVPWVAALRGYGAAISATAAGLSVRFHLDTTGRSLTADQLPFAAGGTAPSFAGSGPISVGVHDPAHIWSFAQAAAQQAGGSGYLKFLGRQKQLRARTGADLNTLLGQLTGDLSLSSDTHTTVARAAVSDPVGTLGVLAKLARDPQDLLAQPHTTIRPLGSGFYAIVEPKRTITVGVVGSQLVIGKASMAQLRAFAAAPASAATGAQGAVAFQIGLPQILQLAIHRSLPQVAQQIFSQLGDITGWAAASPSGIDGSATLAVK